MNRTERYRIQKRRRLTIVASFLAVCVGASVTVAVLAERSRTAIPPSSPAKTKSPVVQARLETPGTRPRSTPVLQTPVPETGFSRNGFSSDILSSNRSGAFQRGFTFTPGFPELDESLGITMFRSDAQRTGSGFGHAESGDNKLKIVWSAPLGYLDEWTGVGWTGQASIVQWPEKTRLAMNLYPEKQSKNELKEVILAALDGKVHFLDLDDGHATRPEINLGAPHKGSLSVDPRGYPLIYAGQGIPTVGGKDIPIGWRIISLTDGKTLYFQNGMDPNAYRGWGAFDSNALIDGTHDSFLECGENGLIYTGKLNTQFDPAKKSISVSPEVTTYRYKATGEFKYGTENSPAIWQNYVYFTDNNGWLQALNTDTLKPLWIANVTDDSDSSVILEETHGLPFLYTACEVDFQNNGGSSYIRKFHGLTGKKLWEVKIPCAYNESVNGGAVGSPVLGKGNISDMVIFNIARSLETGKSGNSGLLLALDKDSGKTVWSFPMTNYSWSSPVAVYNAAGDARLVLGDSAGNLMLLDGKSGRLLHSINLGGNIEASPSVFNDMIVVGTRGQRLFGIQIQ